MMKLRLLLILGAVVCAARAEAAPEGSMKLERVVVVIRHGVRPPTKSAAELAPLSDQAWPDDRAWGAAPGELTPHGAQAIGKLAANVRDFYADRGLVPARGGLAGLISIWADGGDERTRATGAAFAVAIDPEAPPSYGAVAEGQKDPLFGGPALEACRADPAAALSAVSARGPLQTAQVEAGLKRLQQIIAPQGCAGGAGVCLSAPSTLSTDKGGVKISGPLATGATLAENLLLEYENGLPEGQVGWGRVTRADLDTVMPVHDLAADLTRATPYLAARHGGPLAHEVVDLLTDQDAAPAPTHAKTLVVLIGHDTNLSNLAGAFGLSWTLPGQPDATAPGTALAFERWRDPATKARLVRVRVFYQTPDQVRDLATAIDAPVVVRPTVCGPSAQDCRLERFAAETRQRLPPACQVDTSLLMVSGVWRTP